MKANVDWTPRELPGGFYCSPRCGGHKGFCRKSDFSKATKDAAALARSLGDGWEPVVWENLGWHWRVEKGFVEVWRDKDGTYSCWLQGEKQFMADAETAEDAIGLARAAARTFIRRLEDQLADSI